MDRWQRLESCLLLILLLEQATCFTKVEDSTGSSQVELRHDQPERWSKPATAQRRQGDWVPLTVPCPGCQPIDNQESQNRAGISSVLTPPARLQEARLLPPPLPSESLYQQAASAGFIQTFQQPPPFSNKGRQQQIPLQGGQFIQQPIQHNQQFSQHREPNNQNQRNPQFLNPQQNLQVFHISPQAYTQQHAQLLNPSLLNAPQQQIPTQYISGFIPPAPQSAPSQFQQINIAENQQPIPVQVSKPTSQNQPIFHQESSALDQNSNSKPQVLEHQRRPIENKHFSEEQNTQQEVYNNASSNGQNNNEENEEVQLLYVPVEQLRQRGRNLGRQQQNNQFQTVSLPSNFNQQATNIQNSDNLNLPSSPSSELFQENKQNNQFQQQNIQYNQAGVNPPLENSQQFSQIKPNVQYKQLTQTSGLGDIQGFSQNNQNINYRQQAFIPSSDNSQQFIQNKPILQHLQSEITSTFDDTKEFNQNKQDAQYQQPAFTSSSEEVYGQQQELQKPLEKEHQIQQTQIQEDLPQVTTSTYTTPSTKKNRFHKTNENIESGSQLGHQQYLQETTRELPATIQPTSLKFEGTAQNFNSEQNNQRFNFDSNDQNFRTAQNKQLPTPNEQIPQTRTRQPIPARQTDQVYQPQQTSKTVDNQRYITQQSSTIPPPHQPPLSVYMESNENSKVSDVLTLLKNAKTIPVLDTVGPESPQVFVGPSNLDPPNGYIKFELPYLSSLENNRVERKVDKLPFFVAPLNFNPPPGYSKIPFPAPHIGSVVVSNVTILREALHEKPYIVSPSSVSSTTRAYSDYTLPADISPISPQLPSLVNSLQDEIYSPQVTTQPTTSTTTTTTEAYTTPYSRRTQSRGSHRGHSTYLTSTTTSSPRRSPSRTRRPYNGRPYSLRQPVTTSTTTPIPTTEEYDTRGRYTPQAEAQIYDSQPLFSQSNEQGTDFNKGQQQFLQNTNQFSKQQFDTSVNYDSTQENNTPQRQIPSDEFSNQNFPQAAPNLKTQQTFDASGTQYNKNVAYSNYEVGTPTSTQSPVTTENTKDVPSFQGIRDENAFQSQRANNPRRENTLRNQRQRGRTHQRSQYTTTTEASLDSITTTDSQYNPNTYQEIRNINNYNLNVNPFNYKNHKYTEQDDQTVIKSQTQQSNFKHPIQTERSDIVETTESQGKYSPSSQNQYDESFVQPTTVNRAHQNEYSNIKSEYVQQNQFQQQPAFQQHTINIQQQPRIQSIVDDSKQVQQPQLQSAQVLNDNQDYSGQTQQTRQQQFQTSQLVNQQQQSIQPIRTRGSQSVESLNRNNEQYLVQTLSPVGRTSQQQGQPVQNYNSQTQQVSKSKNQQEYYDEVQPTQTKTVLPQKYDEQQYFTQVQSKQQTQPLEPQTSTQQNYLAQVQQPQQRQPQITQQIPQEQYQHNSQSDQRLHQIQNPKYVQQEYNINFQSEAASTRQNDFSEKNRNAQPTEVISQLDSLVVNQNSDQQESQSPTTDNYQSVSRRPHNQQRLTKYSRPQSRTPINSQLEESYSELTKFDPNLQEESQYQTSDIPVHSFSSTTESTTQEPITTTKTPLVRVRGRVRNRQRGQPRTHYTTTTEVPNYPENVLQNEYRTQQSDGQVSTSQYHPQKRINKNYKSRESYDSQQDFTNINTEQTTSNNNGYTPQSQPEPTLYSTTESTTTEAPVTKPGRRYKHVLNRNIQRRPTRPTQSTSPSSTPSSVSSGTPKYLVRTTRRPATRLSVGRARIRKPTTTTTTTTTTEYPQRGNPSWLSSNIGTNFAPSAASNEVIDPYYSNQNEGGPVYNHYEEQVKPSVRAPVATVKLPAVKTVDDDDYWNQGVTIQQSTSYDFKADASPVTQSTFQGTFEPEWDDQLSFKNENYYDNYRPQAGQQSNHASSLDQTPFPSNEQRVVYTEIKNRPHVGKENQWNEKELVDLKNQGENESKESYSVVEQEESVESKKQSSSSLNDQISQNEKQTGVSGGEQFASSEVENTSKLYTYVDRTSTSTEVDKSLIKSSEEEKAEVSLSGKKPGKRRGSWVRVRVKKPQDLFETAESQNLATLSGNAIQPSTKPVKEKTSWKIQEDVTVESTTEPIPEPEKTINFEEALTSMLKDFITHTDSESNVNNSTTEENLQTTTSSENENVTTRSVITDTTDIPERKEETVATTVGLEFTTDSISSPELTTVIIPIEVGENVQTTTDSYFSTVDTDLYETLPSRVIGTSTTTEISLETEICYRGRCVKTKTEKESDLLTTE